MPRTESQITTACMLAHFGFTSRVQRGTECKLSEATTCASDLLHTQSSYACKPGMTGMSESLHVNDIVCTRAHSWALSCWAMEVTAATQPGLWGHLQPHWAYVKLTEGSRAKSFGDSVNLHVNQHIPDLTALQPKSSRKCREQQCRSRKQTKAASL